MMLTLLKIVAGAAVLFMISMVLVAVVAGLRASTRELTKGSRHDDRP
jgi:hypothetical protein